MTRFRSMTDEQMLATYGYDKENQHVCFSGCRCGGLGRSAPRPKCIPSPDPESWVCIHWEEGHSHRSKWNNDSHYLPRPWGTFTPDPEFVRSEVNPILSAFRDSVTPFEMWIGSLNRGLLVEIATTPEQVVHARKVLTKLHNVLEASK